MPVFGEYKTFWFALPFSIVGTVMCFFFVPKNKIVKSQGLSRKEQLAELAEGATILVTNRKVLICAIIRIINNLLLYGFPVIMPLYLCTTHNGGINIFKTEEWMRIWGFGYGRCAGSAARCSRSARWRSTTFRSGSARMPL